MLQKIIWESIEGKYVKNTILSNNINQWKIGKLFIEKSDKHEYFFFKQKCNHFLKKNCFCLIRNFQKEIANTSKNHIFEWQNHKVKLTSHFYQELENFIFCSVGLFGKSFIIHNLELSPGRRGPIPQKSRKAAHAYIVRMSKRLTNSGTRGIWGCKFWPKIFILLAFYEGQNFEMKLST